jgi:hypothetical protein
MKKNFTLEDMEAAFNAGEQRAMWEEGSSRAGYEPTFDEFVEDTYRKKKDLVLTPCLTTLLEIIRESPGSTRDMILSKVEISVKDYNNNLTTLRRRGLIVNMGSRREPKYFATKRS